MAGCKVVTRKLITFQGEDEEFTNVYFFGDGGLGLSPSEAQALDLLDAVIGAEKPIFSPNVRFLGAVAYHVGVNDGPGDTDAIAIRELAATGNQGTMSTSDGIYRECAIDIKWLLGGRRYLRSMLHTDHSHGYSESGATATTVANLSAPIKAFAERMLDGVWAHGYERIAPNGDRPTAIMYNAYLEHRQFHRYRKRNAGLLGQVEFVSVELASWANTVLNGVALWLLRSCVVELRQLHVLQQAIKERVSGVNESA